jgi:hypothetical protein
MNSPRRLRIGFQCLGLFALALGSSILDLLAQFERQFLELLERSALQI